MKKANINNNRPEHYALYWVSGQGEDWFALVPIRKDLYIDNDISNFNDEELEIIACDFYKTNEGTDIESAEGYFYYVGFDADFICIVDSKLIDSCENQLIDNSYVSDNNHKNLYKDSIIKFLKSLKGEPKNLIINKKLNITKDHEEILSILDEEYELFEGENSINQFVNDFSSNTTQEIVYALLHYGYEMMIEDIAYTNYEPIYPTDKILDKIEGMHEIVDRNSNTRTYLYKGNYYGEGNIVDYVRNQQSKSKFNIDESWECNLQKHVRWDSEDAIDDVTLHVKNWLEDIADQEGFKLIEK